MIYVFQTLCQTDPQLLALCTTVQFHHCKYMPILFITPWYANEVYFVNMSIEVEDAQLKRYQGFLFNHNKYAYK